MRFATTLLFCIFPVAFPFPAAAQQVPGDMRLFILAGQSNMSGRGALAELPAGFPEHAPRLWNYSNAGAWLPAREPLDSEVEQVDAVSTDDAPGAGPGLAFADRLAALHGDWNIGLVPCAKGASSITDWAPDAARTSLFGSCVARAREAAANGRISGILWYQGESDAASTGTVMAWPKAFQAMVAAFRAEPGFGNVPVVIVSIGRISDDRRRDDRFRYWDAVRSVQSAVAGPNVVHVDAGRFPIDEKDGLHLSTAGALQLGAAMADALMPLLLPSGP